MASGRRLSQVLSKASGNAPGGTVSTMTSGTFNVSLHHNHCWYQASTAVTTGVSPVRASQCTLCIIVIIVIASLSVLIGTSCLDDNARSHRVEIAYVFRPELCCQAGQSSQLYGHSVCPKLMTVLCLVAKSVCC